MTAELWVTTLGHVAVIIVASLGLLASLANRRQLQALHVDVNSRMDELVLVSRDLGHAEGLATGKAEGQEPSEAGGQDDSGST